MHLSRFFKVPCSPISKYILLSGTPPYLLFTQLPPTHPSLSAYMSPPPRSLLYLLPVGVECLFPVNPYLSLLPFPAHFSQHTKISLYFFSLAKL